MSRKCPNELEHVDGPDGYLDQQAWAEEMLKTHDQIKCPGCGRWMIWKPRANDEQAEAGR